ncbi:E3 ubiquitin-protein ligase RFWD3-like [Hetaerina americana]|uniref:E3 ubiquitin-protein ligase RFWD3-like n=1 Tax=Hetaerina americana TaxID=62018 RepID=UPI003A7F336E
MDYTDSEEIDYDSDVVLLDDENEGDADLSDNELSYGSHSSEELAEFEDMQDFGFENSPTSEDSTWYPPNNDGHPDFESDSTSSTSAHQHDHESDDSPLITAEDVTSASEALASHQENSALSEPSTVSTQPSSSHPTSLVSPENSSSTVTYASTSSAEAPINPALPVEASQNHPKDATEKTIPDRESPRGKKRKKVSENCGSVDSEEDCSGQTCPICMDEWSNSGPHRLCCLKCGHIYGESCIQRWLTSASVSSGRCPQCNTKARIRDIRPLFARSLRAIDTAERDRLAVQLEESKRERERLELEVTRFTMTNELRKRQVEKLQEELELLRKGRIGAVVIPETGGMAGGNSASEDGCQISTPLEGIAVDGNPCHFTLRSSVEIAREGGCRVVAHCDTLNLVVVSQHSTNPLFPGYGVKKVDSLEFRATQFVPVHPKQIRDLAFAPPTAVRCLLLSASFDCTARLLDVSGGANTVVATLSADTPLWSCCWDACDPNLLYVGTQGGIVLSFDVRRTSAPLSRISDSDDISPVISLVPIQPSQGRALPSGGLLSCHLSSCWAHDSSTPGSLRLPYEGPFSALRYEPSTQHFLVSTRPTPLTHTHARHSVCERALRRSRTIIGSADDSPSYSVCNPPVHTFLGGTSQRVLSRPCLLPVHRDLVVAAHQESSSTVALWSVGTGSRVATIPSSDLVIDMCPLTSNGDTHLALLTDKVLRLYKIH